MFNLKISIQYLENYIRIIACLVSYFASKNTKIYVLLSGDKTIFFVIFKQ